MRPTPRFLLSFLACAAFMSAPQTPQCRAEDPPAWSSFETPNSPEEKAMYERRARIRAEIDDIKSGKVKPAAEWGAEWANKYYAGDGLGSNVNYFIAPKSGFVYTSRGCTGLYGFNHGDIIEATPEGVRIRFERPLDPRGSSISEWFYFIRWGDHRYLLSESDLIYMINQFREGRVKTLPALPIAEGRPLLGERAPEGQPVFPERFRGLLGVPPILATVTQVEDVERIEMFEDQCALSAIITIDKGSADNVIRGTDVRSPWGIGFVSILSLEEHSAKCSLFTGIKADDKTTPKVGDTFNMLTVPPEFRSPPPAAPPPAEP